ncbi:MAG: hypothetical protein GX660_26785 [Clostridiaceae bacterium]|nr:hypothetical protein [Clostridiaceae bacterium]
MNVKKIMYTLIILTVIVFSNVISLYISQRIHNQKLIQVSNELSKVKTQLEQNETIESQTNTDDQKEEQVKKYIDYLKQDEKVEYLESSGFIVKEGKIFAINLADGSESGYGESEPFATNKEFKEITDKFIKLYNITKDKITDNDLENAGFSSDFIKTYGFMPFTQKIIDAEILCKEYKLRRLKFELAIERYKNGKIPLKDLQNDEKEFIDIREMMNKNLSKLVSGDL